MKFTMPRQETVQKIFKEYALITASTLLMAVGIYFFKFPNNFTFGGVTGLAVVVSQVMPISPSTVNFIAVSYTHLIAPRSVTINASTPTFCTNAR